MDLPVRYYSTVLTQKMSSSSPRLSMRFIRVPGLRLSLKTMCGFAALVCSGVFMVLRVCALAWGLR